MYSDTKFELIGWLNLNFVSFSGPQVKLQGKVQPKCEAHCSGRPS